MENAKTNAWILYAVALASQKGLVNFAAISQVADGINHAIPSHKELQSALNWLCKNLLVEKQASRYILTPKGETLVTSARIKNETTAKVWAALEQALSSILRNVQSD